MPFNLGLLSDAALEGLNPDTKDALQQQATKQFLIGSLLGGDPSMAFRSATGVPADYFARQQQILSQQQQAERDRAVASAYEPIAPAFNKGSQQVQMLGDQLEGLSPQDVDYESRRIMNTGAGVVPRKFNPAAFMENVLPIIGRTDPTKMAETLKNMRPYSVEGGNVLMNPFSNKPMAYVPSMEKGEEPVFDARGNIVGVKNMEGKVTAIKERALAEKEAAATFDFEKVVNPDGSIKYVKKSEMAGIGQPTVQPPQKQPATPTQKPQSQAPQIPGFEPGVDIAPKPSALSSFVAQQSAPEIAYQEGWKKINDDAYTAYKQANKNSSQIGTLQNIFNRPDFDTNAFTGYKTQLTSVLNAMGIANEKQKDFLNNATSARRAINDFAVNNVSELSGATSDRDIQFSKERFVTLTDPKQSNQYALDLIAASDARKKQFYNFVQNNRTPDVIQRWENSEQGKSSIFETPSMRKYLPQSTVTDGPYKGQTAYRLPNGEVKVFPK